MPEEKVTPPADQAGPICPHCHTKPFLRYAVVDEVTNDNQVFKILYCEDCFCVLNMQFVGIRRTAPPPPPATRSRIQIANPSIDLSKFRTRGHKQ